jgi:ADP-heptose:LPS heptosyltransferase
MKVLIIRFSSIGDIVLTTPVIRTVKAQLDHAEVHYATKSQFRSIFEANPYIDKMHYLDGSLGKLVSELRREKFDYIVDLHNSLRSRLIRIMLGRPSAGFNKLNWKKWLLVNMKINQLPAVHIVDRYLAAASALGVKNDSLGLDYFIPEKDEIPLEWLPPEFRAGYTVYAIGAQHATKRLPLQRMIELCDRINKPLILLGGKDDVSNAAKIKAFFDRSPASAHFEEGLREMNKKTIIYDACGKFNLNQSASLVRQAQYVFSHDTGLMHIAAAFRKEVFSIWGNTVPAFGMYPYRTKFVILEKTGLSCRPCSKLGHDKCPQGHFKCMNEIAFDFYLP